MIATDLWRARIGCFHAAFKFGTAMTSQRHDTDSRVDVHVSDVLVLYALLLLGAGLGLCFLTNISMLRNSENGWSHVEGVKVLGTLPFMENTLSPVGQGHSCIAVYVSMLVVLCATNAVLSVWKILLSNDVQVHPGPTDHTNHPDMQSDDGKKASATEKEDLSVPAGTELRQNVVSCDAFTEILASIQSQLKEQNEQMRLMRKEQSDQNVLVRSELNTIKDNLQQVTEKCENISQRCCKLEDDNTRFSGRMEELSDELGQLHILSTEGRNECANLSSQVSELREEIGKLHEDVDRLEAHSRRENLRMFGVAPVSDKEDYDTCARAVCAALNSVDCNRTWVENDIVRAHRIGQARSGEHRPMIIKLKRWKDKMTLIQDKALRSDLEKKGVRLANDLTRKQADLVATAKREGKVAFFVRGKLTVGPRRHDPHKSPTKVAEESVTTPGVSQPHTTEGQNMGQPPSSPTIQSRSRQQSDVMTGSPNPRDHLLASEKEPLVTDLDTNSTSCAKGPTGSQGQGKDSNVNTPGRQGTGARAKTVGGSTSGKGGQTGMRSYLRGQTLHSNTTHARNNNVSNSRNLRSSASRRASQSD